MGHLHFKGIAESDLEKEDYGQKVNIGWKLSPGQEFGYVTRPGFSGGKTVKNFPQNC